jgi:thiol-disulfide isomerase/thioredoxin
MKNTIKKYFKEIISFALILIVASNLLSLYNSRDLNSSVLNISSVELLDKTTFNIDKSKPILIHFWATWCPICKIEASNIQKISENFQVLSVAVDSKNIQAYLYENSLTFKTVDDKDGQIAKHFNISVFPTTIIYDKNQEMVFSEVGYTSTWGLWIRMLWANQ